MQNNDNVERDLDRVLQSVFACILACLLALFIGSKMNSRIFNPDEAVTFLALTQKGPWQFFVEFPFMAFDKTVAALSEILGLRTLQQLKIVSSFFAVVSALALFLAIRCVTLSWIAAFMTTCLLVISNYYDWLAGWGVSGYMLRFAIGLWIFWTIWQVSGRGLSLGRLIGLAAIFFVLGFIYIPFALLAVSAAGASFAMKLLQSNGQANGASNMVVRIKSALFSSEFRAWALIAACGVVGGVIYLSLNPHPEITEPRPSIHQYSFLRSEFAHNAGGFFGWSVKNIASYFTSMYEPWRVWAGAHSLKNYITFGAMAFGVIGFASALRMGGGYLRLALTLLFAFAGFFMLGALGFFPFGYARYAIFIWPGYYIMTAVGIWHVAQTGPKIFPGKMKSGSCNAICKAIGYLFAGAALYIVAIHAYAAFNFNAQFNAAYEAQIARIKSPTSQLLVIDDKSEVMLEAIGLKKDPTVVVNRPGTLPAAIAQAQADHLAVALAALGDGAIVTVLTYFPNTEDSVISNRLIEAGCVKTESHMLNRWPVEIYLC